MLFEKSGYEVLKCHTCGFRYANFDPGNNFAREFYTDDFFTNGYHKNGYIDYVADERNHKMMATAALKLIERYVAGGALLDVGCAAGYFLEVLGPAWTPYGCEPCEAMAIAARKRFGAGIAHAPFEEYLPEVSFDVVTLWDSLEHVVDPAMCIRKAHGILRENGHLFLRTPDAGSPAAIVLGKAWYHYAPPGHLHFFDRKTISLLLERNGFRMLRIVYLARYVSLAEIVINLGLMLNMQMLKDFSGSLMNNSRWNVTIPYHVFDEMVVVAVKKPGGEKRGRR
ncbi:MAG: class I SAM-dependent methyltransferase [Desulfomonilaceae bacterium]|nr:class I SAM-dependent methyltransferase [Desulfomonilaceae bacterium]